MDDVKDLATGTVATPPSPATSGTTVTLQSGQGAWLPAAPFDAVIAPSTSVANLANSEIVRVTGVSGDVVTMTRAQYGTTARAAVVGDLFSANLTKNLFNQKASLSGATFTGGISAPWVGAGSGTQAESGALRVPTGAWAKARKQDNLGDQNLWRSTFFDFMELGTRVYRDDLGTSGNWVDTGSFLALRREAKNVVIGSAATAHLFVTGQGTTSVQNRVSGLYVDVRDAAGVVNKTITGITQATNAAVAATAHGFAVGDKINVYGVTGMTGANASWTVQTVPDADHFTIDYNSSGAPAYVSGGTATNRPMLYGVLAATFPTLSRGGTSSPNSDDIGLFVAYNGGPGQATDAMYVGHDAAVFASTPSFEAGFTADIYGRYAIFKTAGRVMSGGAIFRAHEATIDAGGYLMTAPNGGSIAWESATSGMIDGVAVDDQDRLVLRGGGVYVDSTGILLLGRSTPATAFPTSRLDVFTATSGVVARFATEHSNGAVVNLVLNNATTTNSPAVNGRHGGGTEAVPLRTKSGMPLMRFGGSGWQAVDDTTPATNLGSNRAGIDFYATQDWTATAQGSRIQFSTTADGAAAQTPRWEIKSDGSMVPITDGVVDIGTSTVRPRDLYVSRDAQIGGNLGIRGPRPYADLMAYGADPTGVIAADSALDAAVAALPATGGLINVPQGNYRITAAHVFDKEVSFQGVGSTGSNPDVEQYTARPLSLFKWDNATGATMFKWASASRPLFGFFVRNIAFDGNDQATIGVHWDRVVESELSGCRFNRFVTNCLRLNTSSATANDNCQKNTFSHNEFRGVVPILIDGNGSNTANTCHCVFVRCVVDFTGSAGIDIIDGDNNTFVGIFCYRRSGTGYSVVLREYARGNYFDHLQPMGGVLVMPPYHAQASNAIFGYDRENGQPSPTITNDDNAATVGAATAGGSLAAGTYYYRVFAYSNGYLMGKSVEVSGTTAGGNLTLPLSGYAVTGADSYRIYRGTSAGGEDRYYTTTATTFNDTGAAATTASMPSVLPGNLHWTETGRNSEGWNLVGAGGQLRLSPSGQILDGTGYKLWIAATTDDHVRLQYGDDGARIYRSYIDSGRTWVFDKPAGGAVGSANTRYYFNSVGGLDSITPYWSGFFWGGHVVTQGGSNRFPTLALSSRSALAADPTDYEYMFSAGNAGTLPLGLSFGSNLVSGAFVRFGFGTAGISKEAMRLKYDGTNASVLMTGPYPWYDVDATAVGDGTTDDYAAIQAVLDAAKAAGGAYVKFGDKAYRVNTGLTLLDAPNVRLIGAGAVHSLYGSAPTQGTILKWGGAAGGTVLTVGASTSADAVPGNAVIGMTIDCIGTNTAATALKVQSSWWGVYRDLHLREGSSVVLDLTTVNLTGTEDLQGCIFEQISIRAVTTSTAKGMRWSSHATGGGNVSMNNFDRIHIYHDSGTGWECGDSDSNTVVNAIIVREAGGTGIGMSLLGSSTSGQGHCRDNSFYYVQPGAGGVNVPGTGTYTQPAVNNTIEDYSLGNSSAGPTLGVGATLYYRTTTGDGIERANNTPWRQRNNAGDTTLDVWSFNSLNEFQVLQPSRLSGAVTIADNISVTLGSTNGTKIGTATTQKLAFWNATPVVQRPNTTDLRQALIDVGILASGGATPLNLNGGAFQLGGTTVAGQFLRASGTAGQVVSEAIAFSRGGTVLNPASGQNIMVWRAPFACTVTNVKAHFKGGTSVVYNARRNQSSTHLSSNQTASTADAWADGGSVQNTAYAAGDDLEIQIVTVTGSVTECAIQVDFTRP